jgi:hypothetical protein
VRGALFLPGPMASNSARTCKFSPEEGEAGEMMAGRSDWLSRSLPGFF